MNISQLRTLIAVVEHGSFSAAARAMGLSQPAVTMQVQALESDLGVTLLDRKYRRLELTEAGNALLPFARRVTVELDAARAEIEMLSGTVSGRLILSASTTPGQYILPRLLGAFLRQYPQVGISLQVADTARVVEAVESGEAHIGMTGAEIPDAKVIFERMGFDDLIMVCPTDSPLVRGPVTLGAVAETPFIMREQGSGTRLVTEEVLRGAGIDPGDLQVVTELGTSEAIVSAVEGGMGVAVVSRWVADKALELGSISAVEVDGFPAQRPLYAVFPRGTRTRAAEAFLDHLRTAFSDSPAGIETGI
ncbi:MAG: LysR family transcriptional regulator [Coriobacteriia bacterium]|nr:LysR family transcriptional regulator [Coriobacteriia bacterium]